MTVAGTVLIVTETGSVACTGIPSGGAAPSSIARSTGPAPVRKRETVVPAAAPFWGEFAEPSAFNTTACPLESVKMPGAVRRTAMLTGCEATPPVRTTIAAWPGGIPAGTCASIRVGETYSSGAASPLMVTETSASARGSGTGAGPAVIGARREPNNAMSDPGAMASFLKLAALVTALTTGGSETASP